VLLSSPCNTRYRKKNRLTDFDYSSEGYYFVTICIDGRVECFGEVENGLMVLNDLGKIVEKYLKQIPLHYNDVVLGEFIVMPNHIHLIINIGADGDTLGADGGTNVGTEQCSVPTPVDMEPVDTPPIPTVGLLSKIIKSFKEVCTKEIKNKFGTRKFVWQRSFYDHIIRNGESYKKIKFYIQDNPAKWEIDRNNQPNLYM